MLISVDNASSGCANFHFDFLINFLQTFGELNSIRGLDEGMKSTVMFLTFLFRTIRTAISFITFRQSPLLTCSSHFFRFSQRQGWKHFMQQSFSSTFSIARVRRAACTSSLFDINRSNEFQCFFSSQSLNFFFGDKTIVYVSLTRNPPINLLVVV